jgi:hypothetical protein
MIAKEELAGLSSSTGFTLYQQEKDYFQHLVLYSIYSKPDKGIVFRGGTALQKAYGLNRYSEDLDFSIAQGIDAEGVAGKAVKYLSSCGYGASLKKAKGWELSDTFKIAVAGPLYIEKESSLCTITLDFSRRNLPEAEIIGIVPPYPDVPQYYMVAATMGEILADKIVALLKRESARDLYDAHFLLKKGAEPELGPVNARLAYWGERLRKGELRGRMEKRIMGIGKIWKRELSSFVPFVPEFSSCSGELLEALRGI